MALPSFSTKGWDFLRVGVAFFSQKSFSNFLCKCTSCSWLQLLPACSLSFLLRSCTALPETCVCEWVCVCVFACCYGYKTSKCVCVSLCVCLSLCVSVSVCVCLLNYDVFKQSPDPQYDRIVSEIIFSTSAVYFPFFKIITEWKLLSVPVGDRSLHCGLVII